MHKPVGTIKDALDNIASNKYVLPAIQRELVWRPDQICALFDTVMQGYPFGEFLFWNIDRENSRDYRWYGFVRDYHQRDNPHCPDLGPLIDRDLTAILDGQQRLTAFNIGLRGSMAVRMPRRRVNNPYAYPKQVLALDLLAQLDPDDEEGRHYTFDFIDEGKIGLRDGHLWFKAADVLRMEPGPPMLNWIIEQGVTQEQSSAAFEKLFQLFQVICVEPSIFCYEESSQDIVRVLNIFRRCNRGGTFLSYSDLLLSTAVSQWTNLDARKEVHGLVDELNQVEDTLFDKDLVLKAGLMLTETGVGFKLGNFTKDNMAKLESNWPDVRQALLETAELVVAFGFNSRTIQASNSLLPIAYYLYKVRAPQNFVTSDQFAGVRRAIRDWLTRSILKESGIWSGGRADTLLVELRDTIRDADGNDFPSNKMKEVMGRHGRGLDFSEEEVEALSEMKYGDRRVFPLLTMLFPHFRSRDVSDVDHVFPKGRFTPTRLRNAGVYDDQFEAFRDNCDRFANLQLLDHTVNNEKRATLPADWLEVHCPDDPSRQAYCDRHLLGDVPKDITGFMEFYEARRERLKQRIAELINTLNPPAPAG